MKPFALMLILVCAAYAVTLEEAIQTALNNRSDVISARNSLQSSIWDRRGAALWFLPKVSAGLTFMRSLDVQELEVPGMGSITMGSEYMSEAGINVDIPLYVAQATAGYSLSRVAEEMAESTLGVNEQDAVKDVIKSFYGVLLAEEMVLVSEEALAIAEESYTIAQMKYDSGIISRFVLLQSEVAWENRKPGVIEARIAAENARAAFSLALGFSGHDAIAEGYLENPLPLHIPETLEAAKILMSDCNPDLTVAENLRDMGSSQVRMAKAEFMPSLLFRTSYNFQAMRDDWHFASDDYERDLGFMISLQIPIFDGYSNISGYNSARMIQLAAEADANALEDAVSFSLQYAWNNLQGARERIDATEYTLHQAEEAVNIAGVSFETGAISQLEMDQSLLALTMARTNRASALYNLRVAEASVLRVCGSLDWYCTQTDRQLLQEKI